MDTVVVCVSSLLIQWTSIHLYVFVQIQAFIYFEYDIWSAGAVAGS